MLTPRIAATVLAILAGAVAVVSPVATAGAAPEPATAAGSPQPGCTSNGRGFLRARLRGALNLDIAWRDAEMQCDGGPRPDGRGLRVTLAGPLQSDGRRLRFVFGIDGAPEGRAVRSRPTNVTLLFEGEQRAFATRGDAWCTTDELLPARVGALGGPRRKWQISARGFCTGPATAVGGAGRIVLSRFDFLAEVTFADESADPADAPPRPPADGAAAIRDAGNARAAGAAAGAGAAAVAGTVELSAGHAADRRR
jgi:hypothetical protein